MALIMDTPKQAQQARELAFDAPSNVERVADAIASRRPLPALCCPDLASGYQFQRNLSAYMNGGLSCDLKAGATSAEVQQHFGLSGPLVGSLYARGKLLSGCEVVVTDGQELEFEIAVVVDNSGNPVSLVPAVEVVYLEFSQPADLSVANAVAANLGADRFICGEPVPWDKSLSQITITVSKDGNKVADLMNHYSFGTPAAGVEWIIDEARRWHLWQEPSDGRTLLLGTCGNAMKTSNGEYCADFGPLGEVRFAIRCRERFEDTESLIS